tara:strand:- start:2286 stop:3239 length:954 start_codon:yes stop_codon:yes gene_type:complete
MGQLVISLDFEKFWGIRDHSNIEDYRLNLERVDTICLEMLKLFSEFEIHVTWATVGLLAFDNKDELLKILPKQKPLYSDINLSPYDYILENELECKFHFSPKIINKIRYAKNQELATHTFSHYYCLEPGQTESSFASDLRLNIAFIKKKFNIEMTSLVFPRNQVKKEYLNILSKNNIKCYRGNETNWIYSIRMGALLKRGFRLIDSYFNITGNNTYDLREIKKTLPYNIPSSCFLRPVKSNNSFFKRIKMRRIKRQMSHAAKNNKLFHLWWHPHNFGNDIDANMLFLKEIFNHFLFLKKKYNMRSLNMKEISKKIEL